MTNDPALRGGPAELLYLGAPAALFLLTFVRPEIGLPLFALLSLSIWRSLRGQSLARTGWYCAAAGGLVVSLITGFPHGPFPWDWVKHWALLRELSSHSWPLSIELDGHRYFLRYYVGAYLVPTMAERAIPAMPLWVPVAVWFTLGYVLVLRLVTSFSPRSSLQWLAVLLILVLGGADLFGNYVYRLLYGYPTHLLPLFGVHNETWNFAATHRPLEYSSNITALAWVPHQAIATFLVAGLMAAPLAQRRFPTILLAFGLLALWSPYGMIGLVPLLLVRIVHHRGELFTPWTVLIGASAAGFALLVAWYLATDLPGAGACFECLPERLRGFGDFVPFLIIELLPFGLILGRKLWTDAMIATAGATLLVIPLVYGETGDFVMRASLGPLFVLGLEATHTLIDEWVAVSRRIIHATALALCAPATISEVVYLRTAGAARVEFPANDPLRSKSTDFVYGDQFTAKQFFDRCGWKYLPQYFTTQRPSLFAPPPALPPPQ